MAPGDGASVTDRVRQRAKNTTARIEPHRVTPRTRKGRWTVPGQETLAAAPEAGTIVIVDDS